MVVSDDYSLHQPVKTIVHVWALIIANHHPSPESDYYWLIHHKVISIGWYAHLLITTPPQVFATVRQVLKRSFLAVVGVWTRSSWEKLIGADNLQPTDQPWLSGWWSRGS